MLELVGEAHAHFEWVGHGGLDVIKRVDLWYGMGIAVLSIARLQFLLPSKMFAAFSALETLFGGE